jgi:linoleoyl-CoA desaturase
LVVSQQFKLYLLKAKHTHNPADDILLSQLYEKVEQAITLNPVHFHLKLWVKFLVFFSLTIGFYASLFWVENVLIYLLCFVLYGLVFLSFAFNFSHDFSHNTIFKSNRLNHFCFVSFYTLLGAHGDSWKNRHVHSHHLAPNVEGFDSDLKIHKMFRMIPTARYLTCHRYQHIYAPLIYSTYSLYWIVVKDLVVLYSTDELKPHKNFGYHMMFWFQKLIYVIVTLVLPLLFSPQSNGTVLLGFFLMHIYLSWALLFTFLITHHVEGTVYPTIDQKGIISTSWFRNQVMSSNDMHPFSRTANFLFGGFNNHIAHHLFPHYHHFYYIKINKILYPFLRKNGIEPNKTSYVGGVLSHLRTLKKLGVKI